MSIDKNNKELYDKILNAATNNDKNIKFKTLEDGYAYCSLAISIGGSIDEGYKASEVVIGQIDACGSGGLSVNGLPPFVSSRSIPNSEPDCVTIQYYIPAGTNIDYEALCSSQNSCTYSGSASIDECSGTFTYTLNDVNDECPSVGGNSTSLCSGSIGSFYITVSDPDITDSYRNLTISIIDDTEGVFTVPGSIVTSGPGINEYVEVTVNTVGKSPGVHLAKVVVSDGVCSVTGNISATIIGSQPINLYSFKRGRIYGDQGYSDFGKEILIPSGLSTTAGNTLSNSLWFDHLRPEAIADCHWSSCTINGIVSQPVSLSGLSSRKTDVIMVAGNLPADYYAGNPNPTGFESGSLWYIYDSSEEGCCGVYPADDPAVDRYVIGPGLEPFKTGIGPVVPFSGANNSSGCYFEPLGTGAFIVAPQTSGNSLYSTDDYFYTYNYGDRNFSGIKHPTETGVLEVVGDYHSQDYILARYASASGDYFNVYNNDTQTWSQVSPFAGGNIRRIISLSYPGKYGFNQITVNGDGRYWILGSGESVIYNAIDNVYSGVSNTSSITGIPANIALVPIVKCTDCNYPVNMSFSDEYYIIPLNTGITSDYPLYLNVNPNTNSGDITDLYAGKDFVPPALSFSEPTIQSYANFKPDITLVHDRVVMSVISTGLNQSYLRMWDNTNTLDTGGLFSTGLYGRVSKTINDQVIWCPAETGRSAHIYDPFANFNVGPVVEADGLTTLDIDAISAANPCDIEYRNLLISASGDKAYLVNAYDRTTVELSFTGSLPMGTYHDIFVFDQLSSILPQSHNFYLLPNSPGSPSPTGSMVAISTTTTSATGITLYGDFTINETVISFEPIQTTTGQIEIGSFAVEDDEFSGGINIGFDPVLGDGNIFTANIAGESGTIYVKSGISLDYETRIFYTGYITGIDPYVGGTSFVDTFVMSVIDIDEKPTGLVIAPEGSGFLNANTSTSSNVEVATFTILDPDITGNQNNIQVAGPDGSFFTTAFDEADNNIDGSLYIKAGTVFDIELKNRYDITLLASKSGETFTASKDWTLYLVDDPPVAVTVSPVATSIYEDYIVPTTGLKLADFVLVDLDSNVGNFVELVGLNQNYFTISYDLDSNSGELRLKSTAAFDYETQTTVVAEIAAGNEEGVYSATGFFTINVLDVYEPTGITTTPSIVYVDEDIDTSSNSILMSTLSWNVTSITDTMSVYDLRYIGSGYRSALDTFTIVNNSTDNPEIHLKQGISLDYETRNRYDIYISGYPTSNRTTKYGGQLTVIVRDVNEAPVVTFDPTGITLPETLPTDAGRFLVAEVLVLDEEQSTVSLESIEADSVYFTLEPSSVIDSPTTAIPMANLYFNSGVSIDINTKDTYTAAIRATDSSGLSSTSFFTIKISDVVQCGYSFSGTITKPQCKNGSNGQLSVSLAYTGDATDVAECNLNSPLSISWNNLPSGASASLDGKIVNFLPTGTINGYIYAGAIPLSGVSFTLSAVSDLTFLTSTKKHNVCDATGYLTVSWTGGVAPYTVGYGNYSSIIPSGSGYSHEIPVTQSVSATPVVRDSRGCSDRGGLVEFSFIDSLYTFISQSLPLVYDDTVEEYAFSVSHGDGPFELNIFDNISGEKGNVVYNFDRYDTSIITNVENTNSSFTDESGITYKIKSNQPDTYYYDLKGKIHPGSYIFEFTNSSGCKLSVENQNVNNIEPMSVTISSQNSYPYDASYYVVVEPILETLFIPYKMLVNNSYLLNYLSTLTSKSDIKIQIGDSVYERKILNGSVKCDTYSILNIKFLGIKDTDWFYTLDFYKGFDIYDEDIDILNQDIFLVLPNETKIKIVTEINNNTNTIKLLKGSVFTSDLNTGSYIQDTEIQLFYYDTDTAEFIPSDNTVNITDGFYYINKYVTGSIFKMNFLDYCKISKNITTDQISSVTFDCLEEQTNILKYRNFLIALNDFGKSDLMYVKAANQKFHSGSIGVSVSNTYDPISVSYRYFSNGSLHPVLINNTPVNDPAIANIKDGSYVIKITDDYGNKPKNINGISYDILYSSFIDYIINDLHTTANKINFAYGDVLVNIYDSSLPASSSKPAIPGTDPPDPPPTGGTGDNDIIITTSTYAVSPNSSYNNAMTIQTDPGKIRFTVTGPNGYNRTFGDKTILIQMPPGIYTIKPYEQDLYDRYLYSQIKNISINDDTVTLVSFEFKSYQDSFLIQDVDIVSVYDSGICGND